MKVFLAGGSGAIGKRLIPLLVSYGHHVVATTRHQTKINDLRLLRAEPVVVDALDRAAVSDAVVFGFAGCCHSSTNCAIELPQSQEIGRRTRAH